MITPGSLATWISRQLPDARVTNTFTITNSTIMNGTFDSVTFAKDAVFWGTTFESASFEKAGFLGQADFANTSFANASFSAASFARPAVFDAALFRDNVSFEDAVFSKDAFFYEARFMPTPISITQILPLTLTLQPRSFSVMLTFQTSISWAPWTFQQRGLQGGPTSSSPALRVLSFPIPSFPVPFSSAWPVSQAFPPLAKRSLLMRRSSIWPVFPAQPTSREPSFKRMPSSA